MVFNWFLFVNNTEEKYKVLSVLNYLFKNKTIEIHFWYISCTLNITILKCLRNFYPPPLKNKKTKLVKCRTNNTYSNKCLKTYVLKKNTYLFPPKIKNFVKETDD